MFLSPKKKGSPVLWIACLLLLFDVRVFFGVTAVSDKYATSDKELPPELQSFVKFTGDGKISVAINGSKTPTNIQLVTESSSALSFRASLNKDCPVDVQTWKFEYPITNGINSLLLNWTTEIFHLGEARAFASQRNLVDVVLNGSEPVLRNVNTREESVASVAPANAPRLPKGGYNMNISVSHTSRDDGCVLTLEFDKEKFSLRKSTTLTSTAVPANPKDKPSESNEKAGVLWYILVPVVVVVLLIVLGVLIFCCVKRRRRNSGSKADQPERGDEFTCVSQTVAQRAEDSKANKVAAISVITENKDDDLKAANERVAIKPKTPREGSTQKSDVSSMSTKMAQESQVVASKESQVDGGKVNSAA